MEDKTEKMINEISKNPVLYNKTDKNYKDMKKRRDVYIIIAEKIGLTGKLSQGICDEISFKSISIDTFSQISHI